MFVYFTKNIDVYVQNKITKIKREIFRGERERERERERSKDTNEKRQGKQKVLLGYGQNTPTHLAHVTQ
jgi:hypothetical protein